MAQRYPLENTVALEQQLLSRAEDTRFMSIDFPYTNDSSNKIHEAFNPAGLVEQANVNSFTNYGYQQNSGEYDSMSRFTAEIADNAVTGGSFGRGVAEKVMVPRVGIDDEASIQRSVHQDRLSAHYNLTVPSYGGRTVGIYNDFKRVNMKRDGVTLRNGIAVPDASDGNIIPYSNTPQSSRFTDRSFESSPSVDDSVVKYSDTEFAQSERFSHPHQIDSCATINNIILHSEEMLGTLLSEFNRHGLESSRKNILNVLRTSIALLESYNSSGSQIQGVGGPHFAAPTMLAHPDEFKNPSSFLKIYGDPSCGCCQNSGNSVGPVKNQSGNWVCSFCSNINFPRRFKCNKCNEVRGSDGDQIVSEYAKSVFQQHRRHYQYQSPQNVIPVCRASKTSNNQVFLQNRMNYK